MEPEYENDETEQIFENIAACKYEYNNLNTSYAYQHEIEISIRLLKKALSNDYEHFKNQVVYERLMKEADYEAYQDL